MTQNVEIPAVDAVPETFECGVVDVPALVKEYVIARKENAYASGWEFARNAVMKAAGAADTGVSIYLHPHLDNQAMALEEMFYSIDAHAHNCADAVRNEIAENRQRWQDAIRPVMDAAEHFVSLLSAFEPRSEREFDENGDLVVKNPFLANARKMVATLRDVYHEID